MLGSTVTRWGFGITQAVKAGELDLYAIFNHYSLDLDTARVVANAVVPSAPNEMDDWMAVTAGMRVNF